MAAYCNLLSRKDGRNVEVWARRTASRTGPRPVSEWGKYFERTVGNPVNLTPATSPTVVCAAAALRADWPTVVCAAVALCAD